MLSFNRLHHIVTQTVSLRNISSKNKLSVVIIARNEEARIADCLRSISWVDEIILVDDESTDKTVQIAKQYGAIVYRHKLKLLGTQWHFGISKASGNWILAMGADERVSKNLASEIKKVLKNPEFNVYNIYFHQFYLGEPLTPTLHGGQKRLFRKGFAYFKPIPVHEGPFTEEKAGQLNSLMLHHSFVNIKQVMQKFNRYAHDEATLLFKSGVRFHPLKLLAAPVHTFLRRQFSDQDYQSGLRGIVLSLLFCMSTFTKWLTIWELEYTSKRNNAK